MPKIILLFCLILTSSIVLCQSKNSYFWRSDLDDSTGNIKMVKIRTISSDSLNYKSIIGYLNGKNSTPKNDNYIVFKKISHDTLYIKINNTFSLTQSYGTAGAMLILSEITYNLTEF